MFFRISEVPARIVLARASRQLYAHCPSSGAQGPSAIWLAGPRISVASSASSWSTWLQASLEVDPSGPGAFPWMRRVRVPVAARRRALLPDEDGDVLLAHERSVGRPPAVALRLLRQLDHPLHGHPERD